MKEFKEYLAKDAKVKNYFLKKYIQSRKPARRSVELLDNQCVKGAPRDDRAIAEKLNKLFEPFFPAEDIGGNSPTRSVFPIRCFKSWITLK